MDPARRETDQRRSSSLIGEIVRVAVPVVGSGERVELHGADRDATVEQCPGDSVHAVHDASVWPEDDRVREVDLFDEPDVFDHGPADGAYPASLCVTGGSPIHSRRVFFSLVCWMKMSCSAGRAGSDGCGDLK